jgi:hypothetical protein
MPARKWRAPSAELLSRINEIYPCPEDCPANSRMQKLFGVLTFDTGNSA